MGLNTIPANAWPPSSDQLGSGGGGSQYVLPIAGAETLGGVKVGTGLAINAETGVLSNSNPTPYSLPIAGAETLGGVKVGSGLAINAETGVLSNTNPTPYTPISYSTTEQNTGKKWIDNKDVFQKVITLSEILTVQSNTWTDTGIDSGMETIINARATDTNGVSYSIFAAPNHGGQGKLGVLQTRSTQIGIINIIVEYTKPTV